MGIGKGKYYALNFPLRDGITNENYKSIFEPVSSELCVCSDMLDSLILQVIRQVMESYDPGAIVLQCGTDSLSGDKLGCFNLSMKGKPLLSTAVHRPCMTDRICRSRQLRQVRQILQQTAPPPWWGGIHHAQCQSLLGVRDWPSSGC